ncbi:hypothetical protein GCM10009601_32540 [Streptomyces thermospinosisporus]|uniref:Uncharacterized protein n=1 Tax=Streptomyces thermospinosisporus TaxID=161482 RepID=A0ABP4JPQ9_9ACTN
MPDLTARTGVAPGEVPAPRRDPAPRMDSALTEGTHVPGLGPSPAAEVAAYRELRK